MNRVSNQLKNVNSSNVKNNFVFSPNPKANNLSNSPSLNSIMSIDLTSYDNLIQRAKDTISKFQDEENNTNNNSKKLHKRNIKENLLIKTDENSNSSELTNVVTEEEYKKKIFTLQSQIKSYQLEKYNLEEELNKKLSDKDFNTDMNKLIKENIDLKIKIKNLTLNEENKNNENNNEIIINNLLKENNKLKKESNALSIKNNELNKIIIDFKSNLDMLHIKEKEIKELNLKISLYEKEKNENLNNYKSLLNQVNQIENMEKNFTSIMKENDVLKKQKNDFQKALNEQNKIKINLKNKYDELLNEKEKILTENKSLRKNNEILFKKNEEIKIVKEKNENFKEKINFLLNYKKNIEIDNNKKKT